MGWILSKIHRFPSSSNTTGTLQGFPVGKEPTCQCRRHKRHRFNPWVGKIPWRRKWQPTPVFLPGKSHGQRSLAGYNPWGHKESHTTECTHTYTHTLTPQETIFFFSFQQLGHRGGGWINGRLSSERGCVFLLCYTQPGKITSPSNKASSPLIKHSWSLNTAYSYGTLLLTFGEVQRFSLHLSSLRSRKNEV